MKTIHRLTLLLLGSLVFFSDLSLFYSQQITRIAPSNITLRGISIADYSHSMVVGDSATIMINSDTLYSDYYHHKFAVLSTPVPRNHSFYGVSYYDSLHAIVVGDAGIVITTSDKGKSWNQQTPLTTSTLRAIIHISGSIFQIVGDGGTIFRSIDNGLTWNSISIGTTKALYGQAFGSANTGFVVGEAGTVLKTTDGGLNWNLLSNAGIAHLNYYAVAMRGEDTAIAVGDSGLARYTNDGGTQWNTRPDSALIPLPFGSTFAPAIARHTALRGVSYTGFSSIGTKTISPLPAIIAVGEGDAIYQLDNSVFGTVKQIFYDTVWLATTAARLGDADGGIDQAQARYTCIAVNNTGPRTLIEFAGPYGEIGTSIDSLKQWFYTLDTLHVSFDNFFFASFDSTGHGYSTVAGGSVLRTVDNGFTWVHTLDGKDVSGVYCQDSNTAFVAGWNGSLFRTTNGGVKWDSLPTLTDYRLHGFAFTSRDTGFCFGGGGKIFRTFDRGATWQDKSSQIFVGYAKAGAFSSPDTGVLVGDNGLMLRTTDGGENWTSDTQEPYAYPEANLKNIQAFADGTYYVGADVGVLKSIDYGQNWKEIFQQPDSIGISFYNSKVGIVGEYSTSSKLVPDSMTLIYTSDGGKTSKEFTVPFYNLHRILAHWLDDHTFLLFGIEGFIIKVDVTGKTAVTEIISPASVPMKVYPNPSTQKNITIEYQTEKEGFVTISLYDELGKQIAALYSGYEVQGKHEQVLTLDADLHGTFFIRADEAGKVQTLRMIKL